MEALIWDEAEFGWYEVDEIPANAELLSPEELLAAIDSVNASIPSKIQKITQHHRNIVGMGVCSDRGHQFIIVVGDNPRVTAEILNTLFTDDESEDKLYNDNSSSFDWDKIVKYLLANR